MSTKSKNDKTEQALNFVKRYGKFNGRRFEEIPDWHLRWLAENAKNDTVATMADIVMQYRDRHDIEVEE